MLSEIQKAVEKVLAVPSIKAVFDSELAKHTEAVTRERAGLAAQLQKAEDDFVKTLAVKNAAVEKAKKVVGATEAAHKKATDEYAAVYLDRRDFVNRHEGQKTDIEKRLIESADSRVDEAISFFKNTLSKSLADDQITVNKSVRAYKVDGTPIYDIETNRPAVTEKHAHLRTAIDALQAMKLQPAYDDAAVQALIDGIPSTDIFTGVE